MYNEITPMGSSRPAFRDGQSSRRKEISRLFELKRKTIVFKPMVFFVKHIFMKAWIVFRLVNVFLQNER
jgi:hypothetical protein